MTNLVFIQEEDHSQKNQFEVLEGLDMDDFQEYEEPDMPSKKLPTEGSVSLEIELLCSSVI